MKPALSRGEIQVIGATTFNEYRKYIEKDAALERRFQPVTVAEPSIQETIEVLLGIKNYYEDYKNNNYWSGGLKYPFSSKIFCMEHNTNFQRSHGSKNKNRPTWTCSLYQQFRIDACSSPIISESDLYNIIYIVLKKILPKKNIIAEELFELYKNINKDSQYDIELDYIDKYIKKIDYIL